MPDPDPFAQLDAAYSLGALDADDLAAYEGHLRGCAACRVRVEQLRPTVRLLAAARVDDPTVDAVPDTLLPDTLLPGLLRRAERERTRRRWVVRSIAGFAAACLVTLVVVLWPASTSRPASRALVAVRTTPVEVEATARLVARPWGTEIDVRCRHERYAASSSGGARGGSSYGLRVIDRDRNTYNLGTWSAESERAISFTGGTAVRRERIARVQITLPDGTPILQLVL
ncbi:anti-sigma factor family protein [uncultured Jatrophihabitans sp.]|uniref:anti-sigma factor family protein n=1 Tax=uncultured Jatrophihabitans sp. TaxID=1610747 RepID=UPI0035CC1470